MAHINALYLKVRSF